jgi:hypothetical protein
VSRQEPHARSLKPEQTDRLNWTKVQHQTRDGRQAVGSRRSCADFMFIGCSLRKRTRVQLRRGLRPRQGSTVTAPYRASPLSNRIPERHEESRGLGWCHCTFTRSASIGPRSNAHCKGRRSATGLRHRLRRCCAHRSRVSTLQRSLSACVSSFRAVGNGWSDTKALCRLESSSTERFRPRRPTRQRGPGGPNLGAMQ